MASKQIHPSKEDPSTLPAGLPEQVMSAHGWDDPTRSGQLAADIEEMMVHLVDGVHRNPPQRSFARLRVVVDDAARPVAGPQPIKHIGRTSAPRR